MRLGLRLLFAFFLVAGLAGFFVLQVFVAEVRPSVREVMEDIMVDTANLLAEQAADELRALPPRDAEGLASRAPGRGLPRAASRRADLGPAQAHARLPHRGHRCPRPR